MGSVDKRIHEPNIRRKRLKYWLNAHGSSDLDGFKNELNNILAKTNYSLITVVIRKDEYQEEFEQKQVDMFLPISPYHIALDFVLERFVHYLHYKANDAEGLVIAERIGPKEAAQLMNEYSRLQLEGTQYISDSWFRYQLAESIIFGEKQDLMPGLEMTDVIARPIAEKVIDPSHTPVRWEPIRKKFYDGGQGRPESYGLKVFPTPVGNDFFQ